MTRNLRGEYEATRLTTGDCPTCGDSRYVQERGAVVENGCDTVVHASTNTPDCPTCGPYATPTAVAPEASRPAEPVEPLADWERELLEGRAPVSVITAP